MSETFAAEGRYEASIGQHCYLHDGVAFPMSSSAALLQAIQDFPCQADDVTIVGFPKSGTNWLQAMVQKLYEDDWGTLKISGGIVPHIDITSHRMGDHGMLVGFQHCMRAAGPRLMKAHSHYRHMPRGFREKGLGKAIVVARNPKDVCDSLYNQIDLLRAHQGLTLDWDSWVEHFIDGKVVFGPWLDHVLEWNRHDASEGVLNLRYEEIRVDARATLRRVADFIGRPVVDDMIESVIAQTEFSKMQEGEGAKLYNGPVARREGKSGGWRKHFTVAQNDRFDRMICDRLEAEGIRFNYG